MSVTPVNIDVSVGGCQQEAAAQLSTASALDAKLMGVLGLMTAVAALLVSVPDALHSYRWILLVGSVASIILALLGLIGADDPKAGPDPIAFYREFGGGEPDEFAEQLLADLGKTLDENGRLIEMRRAVLTVAFVVATLGGAMFGAARLLVWILS
jgi:hypothetical protein